MNCLNFLKGMGFFSIAAIIDCVGDTYGFPTTDVFTGLAILLGLGYIFLYVIGSHDPKIN